MCMEYYIDEIRRKISDMDWEKAREYVKTLPPDVKDEIFRRAARDIAGIEEELTKEKGIHPREYYDVEHSWRLFKRRVRVIS